ncbi:alpha-amylase family glycosyl hydrolase [uncultured Friedmanniella sp.]|uniref:alpha-amylase family glycosyl hydrolase n=1 Tax=uncultured Friedmanniella sp. TaxID=335381 RepID=UPI0035CA2C4B
MLADDRYLPARDVEISHPQWCRNATIYQVNTRQFTAVGTFAAAAEHLPRLKELGVSILWLMPVHPIGESHRKGGLGSPYSVRDYYGVNPELGTADDLRAFVASAHELGLRVILDWVANHTAWDCTLLAEHPEWYARDYKGDVTPTPWWDWDDIIDLDYRVPELRQYMTEAMVHWVREYDLDGFRCDVAGFVPTDFWETVRRELDQVKPVFLLAEWESRDLHRAAFDMSYAWSWNEALHAIAMGEADVELLRIFYSWDRKAWPDDSIRMMFVANHDKNAWEGTEYEMFGDALEAAIVLSVVGRGMPLVHNGQEAGLRRRLKFFDRDPIEWRNDPMADFYRRLIALRRDTPALWSGGWGAHMVPVPNDAPSQVLSFVRSDERYRVLALFNFSGSPVETALGEDLYPGHYRDFASSEVVQLTAGEPVVLAAWGWQVLIATGPPYVA